MVLGYRMFPKFSMIWVVVNLECQHVAGKVFHPPKRWRMDLGIRFEILFFFVCLKQELNCGRQFSTPKFYQVAMF